MLAENGIAAIPGTANGFVVGGNYVDGSWELSVFVEDLDQDVKVRVLGDLTIGGLMHRIVEDISLQQSWSDHGIWWASRNMWLLHNRTTLDQCGIQSDARLVFRRMHGMVRIILPSLVPLTLRLSFASSVYHVVVNICKQLNIRHPEELSLKFPITRDHLKTNTSLPVLRHGVRRPLQSGSIGRSDTSTLNKKQLRSLATTFTESDRMPCSPYETLRSGAGTMMRLRSNQSLDDDLLDGGRHRTECILASRSAKIVFDEEWLMRPNGLIQKARLNSGWLDSSRSLLEHGVEPLSVTDTSGQPPVLYLCFKYHMFYDLNMKYDAVRIHQLFEHARWSLLSGVLDCTEDEMIVFAAYQLQAQLQPDEQHWGNAFFNPFTTPYFPTLGPSSTLGGIRRASGSRLSPDLSRRQYMTLGSNAHGGIGHDTPLLRMPGTVSPASGTSLLDGTSPWSASECGAVVDEVDELLAGLEKSCGVAEEPGSAARSLRPNTPLLPGNGCSPGPNSSVFDSPDTVEIPSLQDSLRVYKDSNRFLRRPKVYWVVIRETSLYLFRNERELDNPVHAYSLRDCTVTPAVNASSHKYVIRLHLSPESAPGRSGKASGKSNGSAVPARPTNREELVLRFEAAEQYARWLAACRLLSRGKTLASRVVYEREMAAIWDTLRLQLPGAQASGDATDTATKCLGDLTDFCTERIIRKARSKQHLRQRIAEAHANLRDLTALESKCKYIQAWQQLTGFGRSYFTASYERPAKDSKMSGNGKRPINVPPDHLVAISPSGVELISPQTGDIYRSWTFTELKSWDVNWETSTVSLEFRSDLVLFRPLCANCKTIIELLGGYVCLGMRTPEGNQEFNERLFLRLIGTHD